MKKMGFGFASCVCALSLVVFGCSNVATYEDDSLYETKAVETSVVSESVSASRSVVTNYVTYTMAPEICTLVYDGYNEGVKGPISVTKGTMKSGYTSKIIYLITLSGTEDVFNQSTGYLTDALSGFNLKSPYYNNVVKTITDNIPSGANLILAGHSLGGMIAQQVAADDTVKKNYNVLNTVTFGSPLLSAGSREGTTKRLGDTSDVIPYASGSLFNNTLWAVMGLNRENGGYGLDCMAAHTESYLRSDVWGKYDVVGTKKGSVKLVLDLNTRTFYKNPVISF